MKHLLPESIEKDDPACGWSFTLYFVGECLRRAGKPMSAKRLSLLLMMMDVRGMTDVGSLMRPYERFRVIDGSCELWSINKALSGKWGQFDQLIEREGDKLTLRAESLWMLDCVDYNLPMALKGSTSTFSDQAMDENIDHWFAMNDDVLLNTVQSFFGLMGEGWQTYGDLIPAMPGPDKILRDHLQVSWQDQVFIDAAFRTV